MTSASAPLAVFAALIVGIFAIFLAPTVLRAFRDRPPRAYTDLEREQRVEATAFFYALPPQALAEVRALPSRIEKEAALRSAYERQNPAAPAHEAARTVNTFFTLYAEEVGLQGGLYHRRASGKVQLGGSDSGGGPVDFGGGYDAGDSGGSDGGGSDGGGGGGGD